ncbi:DNA polymerase I [Candidatus Mycosynbacter amalyticus]|uniref:DNA polymerase I n=1 Tax=Candidatus Mycosynbacter amalyticus TaxID=2665156 RepID=A0A857MIG7_9BACT|nr:DNA polymerase I [Candidatus Mycosynbacter amalyticus]QHN42364.1 DNA polymerase I [Candidatus Mycosynbacter amalyticus]
MTKRLVLIDGMSVFYRGYFAMPGLSLPDGTPTGGVYGFASIAVEVIKKLEPDYVVVAWDKTKTATRKRKEIYPDYKAGRTRPPEDFFAQIPLLHELLASFGWPLIEMDDYEADDIIGTIAAAATAEDIETCVVSGDYDMMQLLNSHTSVYINKKGADMLRFTEAEFEEKYGVKLAQFVDYKALVGDSSDNIPGARGIGPKAAEKLLSEYDTIDDIYAHIDELKGAQKAKLEAARDEVYMSRELAKIWCDAPVYVDWDEADVHNTDLPAVATKLRELNFQSLIKRLPAHMQDVVPQGGLYIEHKIDSLSVEEWTDDIEIDEKVVLHVSEGEVWLSLNRSSVMRAPMAQVAAQTWQLLGMARVIGYDIKAALHGLDAAGIMTAIDTVHDVRQAAFLIDPLQRDRSLPALLGSEVDMSDAGDAAAALWSVYDSQVDAFTHKPKVADIAERFDFPLVRLLFDIERRGVKIDTARLHEMSKELGDEYQKLQQQMYDMVGYDFNIGSPAQLGEVLFTKLQLPTVGVKRGKTGYSTDQKTLDKLKGQHPVIDLIERTRELAKLKNTYVDALPELADEHGRLHTTFNQDVAATGRLSSTAPNLQNIPIRSELGRTIRTAFVAEPGNVLVSADYSQFELRLAAVLANDKELIEDFNNDVDIHTKTAAEVYGIPMGEVTKNQRRDAKVINFGVLYGMSPHGLAAATGMSFGEAKTFIDQYFALRAPIRKFIDDTLAKAESEGYAETYFGRRRPTPDVKSSNFMVRESAKRAAANMPIQGTEADLMKLAMLKVEQELGDSGMQILQIHDSILVETPKANAEKVGEILKTNMESIAPELPVKLKVDVSVGENWGLL